MWLSTKPEGSDVTRKERFISEGTEVIYPELRSTYLFDYLLKLGAVSNNGMGTVGLSWQELNAWKQATGIPLNEWELTVIYKASDAYASQLTESRKYDCPMPEKVIEQDPLKLAKRIKSVLR